jgi:hypothetical protein
MLVSVTLDSRATLRTVRPDRTSSTILARKSAGNGGLLFGILESSTRSEEDSTKRDQLHEELLAATVAGEG